MRALGDGGPSGRADHHGGRAGVVGYAGVSVSQPDWPATRLHWHKRCFESTTI